MKKILTIFLLIACNRHALPNVTQGAYIKDGELLKPVCVTISFYDDDYDPIGGFDRDSVGAFVMLHSHPVTLHVPLINLPVWVENNTLTDTVIYRAHNCVNVKDSFQVIN